MGRYHDPGAREDAMSSNDDLLSANPDAAGVIVYGKPDFGPLEFIPEADAFRTALVVHALTEAQTWGDLRRLDPDVYQVAFDAFGEERDRCPPEDEDDVVTPFPPPDDADFDLYEVSWHAGWLSGYTNDTLEWVPEPILERYGSGPGAAQDMLASWDTEWLDGDEDEIVAALRAHGFTLRKDPDLIRLAALRDLAMGEDPRYGIFRDVRNALSPAAYDALIARARVFFGQ